MKKIGNSIFRSEQRKGVDSALGNWRESSNKDLLSTELGQSSRNMPITFVIPAKRNIAFKPRPTFFKNFLKQLEEVEKTLIRSNNKYENPEERIHVIRGVYYGTEWNIDYQVEKSDVRNRAFQTYTSSLEPDDIRKHVSSEQYWFLFNSFEIYESSSRRKGFDFGHAIIGLDARASYSSRNIAVPFHGGGTGLEVSTWLGDLGGAAGMLSIKRMKNPSKRAIDMFKGSSFGGWVNLEGDVAAYCIANNIEDESLRLKFEDGKRLSDSISNYLYEDKNWENRVSNFLKLIGAKVNNGKIQNKEEFLLAISSKIFHFAELYMTNRLIQSNSSSTSNLLQASKHLFGATVEVTSIFLHILENNMITNKNARLESFSYNPEPSKAGKPLKKFIYAKELEKQSNDLKNKGEELMRDVEETFRKFKSRF